MHNWQRITGNFNTKANVQPNHTYTATTHGVQRRQQQQNKSWKKDNGKGRNQWGNKKSRTANNDKKNKPFARAGLDE